MGAPGARETAAASATNGRGAAAGLGGLAIWGFLLVWAAGSGCEPSRAGLTPRVQSAGSAARTMSSSQNENQNGNQNENRNGNENLAGHGQGLGLAAPVPRERWRPGYGLVELRPGAAVEMAALAPAAPFAASPTGSAAVGSATGAPVTLLGGVRVQALREVVAGRSAGPGTEPDAGAIVLFALPDARDEAATRAALARVVADPRVVRAEPDRLRRAAAVPNDPLFSRQWSLPMIRLPQAWELTRGSEDVVVAFLDTGIVSGHPDLAARLVAGYDFISDPNSADDGNHTRDADPTDTGTIDSSRLHGLHVAGIIGALTNNNLGIAGVDQKCRLLPVRVLGVNGGDGMDSDIADAVRWASGAQVGGLPKVAQPANILNMSFGGPGISFTLQRAIDDALSRGVVVIAAAGNGGDDAATYSPGGLDGVIAVGAAGEDGIRASYSNFGPRVDLMAPGGGAPDEGEAPDMLAADLAGGAADGILSTYRDDGVAEPSQPPFSYGVLAGTSQAAPHVSGAAALVKSILPGVGPRTLAMMLRESADSRYRCPRDALGGCGAGLLDVEALLRLAGQQRRCGCSGDLYCVEGSCIMPMAAHPSIFDRPVIHGGWCALGGFGAGPADGRATLFAVAATLLFAALKRPRYLRAG